MTSHSKANNTQQQLLNPWKLKFFFWRRLPSLLFWRVRLLHLDDAYARVSIPFTKRTQNPFRSIYFAAQAGAAEFSTGSLAASALEGQGRVSMLVTGMRAEYYKKAAGTIEFTCTEGAAVRAVIQKAVQTGEGQKITMQSDGKDASGDLVASFWFEWSFKKK